MKPPKFLTSRSTVITLFAAISGALLVASVVPQYASTGKTPAWVGKLPDSLNFLSTHLGLDNIVSTGWFAVLVTLFWMSLVISTISQYSATRALSNHVPPATLPQGCVRVDTALLTIVAKIAASGYRPAGDNAGIHRFVKNRIGYWGNFLLHIGLVITVLFSLIYVLTQHRALVRVTGQEITTLSSANIQELKGLLAHRQELPYSMVLKTLEPHYWPNDKLERLSSELYFTGKPGDEPQRVDVAVSDKSTFGSYIVYQANVYGRTFDLELQSASGQVYRERLYLPYPSKHDTAGYGEIALTGTDLLLKGKFFSEDGHRSMQFSPSPLTIRLYRGTELQGEALLDVGASKSLGPFSARLAQSEWWTDVMLDGTRGNAGIFAGFALILTGVLCSYCLVPREIIIREADGALYAQHVVRRFAQFYREEFDELVQTTATTGEI